MWWANFKATCAVDPQRTKDAPSETAKSEVQEVEVSSKQLIATRFLFNLGSGQSLTNTEIHCLTPFGIFHAVFVFAQRGCTFYAFPEGQTNTHLQTLGASVN